MALIHPASAGHGLNLQSGGSTLVPQSGTRNVHRHEEVMAKIIDLQNEISGDVANLIDVKRETMNIIKTVENVVYRMILEERYL